MEFEEKIQDLQNEINNLTDQSNEKDIYIKRLKRRTVDFEDVVYNSEKEFVDQINKQKIEITVLRII